ncbi:MAG: hypothetical protein H6Q89_4707 [Myxococcaceae bacterium]|nr:hypothetical protein [Myxococcaceae bacterium]
MIAAVRTALGGQLRSLVLFGSCLSPATRRPGSIPDLFAVVDDLDAALGALEVGKLGRWVAPLLPPVTLALQSEAGPIAKLNVIDARTLARELGAENDLYLAGRLGKRTECLWARDEACRREIDHLRAEARRTIARVALLGLPRLTTLEPVLRRCVSLSYEAEPRPERPAKIRALYDAFADWYPPRYAPLLTARALELGIAIQGESLIDKRPDQIRAAEARGLSSLLRRSWLRAMARWPKGILLYRGWFPYLVGKLRRAWAF